MNNLRAKFRIYQAQKSVFLNLNQSSWTYKFNRKFINFLSKYKISLLIFSFFLLILKVHWKKTFEFITHLKNYHNFQDWHKKKYNFFLLFQFQSKNDRQLQFSADLFAAIKSVKRAFMLQNELFFNLNNTDKK